MDGAWIGAAWALAGACCFALGNIAIVRAKSAGGDKGATLSVLITAVVAGLAWLIGEGAALPSPDDPRLVEALLWFALAGLFVMALGRALVFASLQKLGVTRASAVKRVNPFFSVLLAALVLGEAVTWIDAAGMVLIGAGFGLLVWLSFRAAAARPETEPPTRDYLWGLGAGFAYAASYVARKLGLAALALPAFGTMVSALAGLLAFAVLALFLPRFRRNLAGIFRDATPATVAAGVAISFGQICTFSALAHADVMTVVMIGSLEVFISSFLAVVVFRTERRASAATLFAAGLAIGGAVTVAAG